MALDNTQLVLMGKALAKAQPTAPVAYSFGDKQLSYEALNETLRQEMNELAGTYSLYRENILLKKEEFNVSQNKKCYSHI